MPLLHLAVQSKNTKVLEDVIATCGDKINYLQKDAQEEYVFYYLTPRSDFQNAKNIKDGGFAEGVHIISSEVIKREIIFPYEDYINFDRLPHGIALMVIDLALSSYYQHNYAAVKLAERFINRDYAAPLSTTNAARLKDTYVTDLYKKLADSIFQQRLYLNDNNALKITHELLDNRQDVANNFLPRTFKECQVLDHWNVWLRLVENKRNATDFPPGYITPFSAYVYVSVSTLFDGHFCTMFDVPSFTQSELFQVSNSN